MSAGFWAMGGYALYVWPAYGLSLLALIGLGWTAWSGLRRATREVAALPARKR